MTDKALVHHLSAPAYKRRALRIPQHASGGQSGVFAE